jgi:rod shape determining protein RodA
VISRKELLRDFDKTLLVAVLVICAMGLLFLLSATSVRNQELNFAFVRRQLASVTIALFLMFLVLNINYRRFIDISWILYGINIGMLILLIFMGHARLGAQRWFAVGSFTVQPSEFIKLNLILVLASYMNGKKGTLDRLENLIIPFLLCGIPFLLVVQQPDLGTGLLLVPVLFSMLYVAGANWKHLASIGGSGLACAPFLWHFLKEYQKQRLLVFMNPNVDPLGAGYTIIQSKIAIGSGGLFGKGWLAGTQNQLNFLPERHTDFIFSVVGEEWGFFGSLLLVLLYFLVIRRVFRIASLTSDLGGALIATGIGALLAFQVLINIGMTIGLMPVVGIPLPLVSYGGSSLLTTFAAIGFALNVGMRRSTF